MKLSKDMWNALAHLAEVRRKALARPGLCPNVTPGLQEGSRVHVAHATIRALQARGLVEDCRCPVDHETEEVRLTPAGIGTVDSLSSCIQCIHDRVHDDGLAYCGRRDGSSSAEDSAIEAWSTSRPLDSSDRPTGPGCPSFTPRGPHEIGKYLCCVPDTQGRYRRPCGALHDGERIIIGSPCSPDETGCKLSGGACAWFTLTGETS